MKVGGADTPEIAADVGERYDRITREALFRAAHPGWYRVGRVVGWLLVAALVSVVVAAALLGCVVAVWAASQIVGHL